MRTGASSSGHWEVELCEGALRACDGGLVPPLRRAEQWHGKVLLDGVWLHVRPGYWAV